MRKTFPLVAALCGCTLITPMPSFAQQQDGTGGDLVGDVFSMLTTANWNVFANGGATRNGRFLLQEALGGGQRALRGTGAWNLGLGGGVDILPRTSVRMGYSYMSSDLEYRTDIGDGSDVLDIDDGAGIHSHLLSLEIMRYMFPSASYSITPYGSAGVTGMWWTLDESNTIAAPGGSTQFRVGAIASFGVQFEMADHWDARVEFATGTNRNPFTGNESYVGFGGLTVDEPTRVSRSDLRIAGVYRFTGRDEKPPITASRRPTRR